MEPSTTSKRRRLTDDTVANRFKQRGGLKMLPQAVEELIDLPRLSRVSHNWQQSVAAHLQHRRSLNVVIPNPISEGLGEALQLLRRHANHLTTITLRCTAVTLRRHKEPQSSRAFPLWFGELCFLNSASLRVVKLQLHRFAIPAINGLLACTKLSCLSLTMDSAKGAAHFGANVNVFQALRELTVVIIEDECPAFADQTWVLPELRTIQLSTEDVPDLVAPHLTSCSLTWPPDTLTSRVMRGAPNLRCLDIDAEDTQEERDLETDLWIACLRRQQWQHMETLTLSRYQSPPHSLLLMGHMVKLSFLSLCVPCDCPPDNIRQLLLSLPSLEALFVRIPNEETGQYDEAPVPEPAGVDELLQGTSVAVPRLERLLLELGDATIFTNVHFPRLTQLHLEERVSLHALTPVLAKCPQLTSLYTSGCRVQMFSPPLAPANLPQLKQLAVYSGWFDNAQQISAFRLFAGSLEYIGWSYSRDLLLALAEVGAPELCSLDISYEKDEDQPQDAALLLSLFKACPKLRKAQTRRVPREVSREVIAGLETLGQRAVVDERERPPAGARFAEVARYRWSR